ncbi:MAG: hypothetical protein ACLTKG_01875 [Collinsella intestinalis]
MSEYIENENENVEEVVEASETVEVVEEVAEAEIVVERPPRRLPRRSPAWTTSFSIGAARRWPARQTQSARGCRLSRRLRQRAQRALKPSSSSPETERWDVRLCWHASAQLDGIPRG